MNISQQSKGIFESVTFTVTHVTDPKYKDRPLLLTYKNAGGSTLARHRLSYSEWDKLVNKVRIERPAIPGPQLLPSQQTLPNAKQP